MDKRKYFLKSKLMPHFALADAIPAGVKTYTKAIQSDGGASDYSQIVFENQYKFIPIKAMHTEIFENPDGGFYSSTATAIEIGNFRHFTGNNLDADAVKQSEIFLSINNFNSCPQYLQECDFSEFEIDGGQYQFTNSENYLNQPGFATFYYLELNGKD